MDYNISAILEFKDKYSSKIQSAKASFKNFSDSSARSFAKFKMNSKSAVDSFIKDERKMRAIASKANKAANIMAVGAVATGGALWSMFSAYKGLNYQLVKNAAISNSTVAEQEKLKNQTKELGNTTIFTAREIAMAQQYQAMAGYNANKQLEITPKLLKLSIASGEDLAKTSDLVTDNLSAFRLGTKDLDRMLDVMAFTANNTNTTIAMLGDTYKQVAATSSNFESFESVNVMFGLLANNGTKAGDAGTALNSIYARLSKPTDDMVKAFKKTGTTLYDKNNKFKGLKKIIEEAKPALDKMTDSERNNWVATIAGINHLSKFNILLNSSGKEWNGLTDKISNSKGSLDKFTNKMKDADDYKVKLLSSAFDNLKLTIGEAVAPAMLEGITFLTEKINSISGSESFRTDNLKNFFSEVKAAVVPAIALFGSLKMAALAGRAAAGDPVAMAVLAAGAGEAGYHIINKISKDLEPQAKEITPEIIARREEITRSENRRIAIKKYKKTGMSEKEAHLQYMRDSRNDELIKNYGKKNASQNKTGMSQENSNNSAASNKLNLKGSIETFKPVSLNITGPITISNNMDIETFANNLLSKIQTMQ